MAGSLGYDPDDYPEGHSPYCHRSCTHPCHDAYDKMKADELDRLRQEVAVLREYLDDDLLLRLAVEHGWPHEPDNSLGKWCCDEHRESFYDRHPRLKP